MWTVLLALALTSATPATQATELAKKRAWDQLLLKLATVRPSEVSDRDRVRIGQALAQGCVALERSDASLAFDLGQHAAAMDSTSGALLCWANTARRIRQYSTAEDALRIGARKHPRDGRFPLELGRLLLEEGDLRGAEIALRAVHPPMSQTREARALSQHLHAQGAQTVTPRQEPPAADGAPLERSVASVGFESGTGPGDLRTRDNRYFHFKYFNNQRDFGQRAEFEGQVASALEDARLHTHSLLGVSRESPIDVILYTREEFALHQGEAAARAFAGLYSQNAIRVNAALELTPDHRATLTHEYVHAVIDELAKGHSERVPTWMNEGLAEYLEWRFQGQDNPPAALQARLHALARRNALPTLSALSHGMLASQSDPPTLYAYSAVAARLLYQQAGAAALIRSLRALGDGEKVEDVFPSQLGRSLSDLERTLSAELSGR